MKFPSKTIFLILLFVYFLNHAGESQTSDPTRQFCLHNMVPPPPGTASLGKYGNIPLNLFAGSPVIEIPLWDVKGRQLSIPLTLCYNATGIKVEQNSDWTGIGWTISGVGSIMRNLRGRADELSGGYFQEGHKIPDDINQLYTKQWSFEDQNMAASGFLDFEPDIFSFNFPGHSGEIVFDVDETGTRTPIVSPYQNLKIDYTRTLGIRTWSILDESGTLYNFGSQDVNEAVETSTFDQGVCNDHNQPYYSSWQLKNIISPDKGDTIKFTYINVTENYYTGVAESINIKIGSVGPPEITSSCTANDYSCCLNEMEVDAKRLYKIETASTIISFITDTTVAINGGKKLTAIIIKNRVSGENNQRISFLLFIH